MPAEYCILEQNLSIIREKKISNTKDTYQFFLNALFLRVERKVTKNTGKFKTNPNCLYYIGIVTLISHSTRQTKTSQHHTSTGNPLAHPNTSGITKTLFQHGELNRRSSQ